MKLLLILALTLVACKKEEIKNETVQADPIGQIQTDPATPKPPQGRCTNLGFSSHEPMAEWKMKNGEELVVCSVDDASVISETEFLGWINIYPGTSVAVERGYIKEVSSSMPIYVFNFGVKKLNDSSVEIAKYAEDTKISSAILDCSTSPCSFKKEKCEKKAKLEVSNDALLKMENITAGKSQEIPDESDVANTFRAAASGDKRAIKIILSDRHKLKLDGAAAAGFDDSKEVVLHLVDLGCLKP